MYLSALPSSLAPIRPRGEAAVARALRWFRAAARSGHELKPAVLGRAPPAFFIGEGLMGTSERTRQGRRAFLRSAAALAGAAALGCDAKKDAATSSAGSNPGSLSPSDGPETPDLT